MNWKIAITAIGGMVTTLFGEQYEMIPITPGEYLSIGRAIYNSGTVFGDFYIDATCRHFLWDELNNVKELPSISDPRISRYIQSEKGSYIGYRYCQAACNKTSGSIVVINEYEFDLPTDRITDIVSARYKQKKTPNGISRL